jgi:hypothetical protein
MWRAPAMRATLSGWLVLDETSHSMIAVGDLHTVYDPVHRDLIFFFPDQDVEIEVERNLLAERSRRHA